MKKRLVMIAGVCVCTLIAAAGLYQNYSKNEKYQKQLFAMDTYMEFTAYGRGGQQAVEKAAKKCRDWMHFYQHKMKKARYMP